MKGDNVNKSGKGYKDSARNMIQLENEKKELSIVTLTSYLFIQRFNKVVT